jgi:hypothetical protein
MAIIQKIIEIKKINNKKLNCNGKSSYELQPVYGSIQKS